MNNLTFLRIDRLIIHELPNPRAKTAGVLSDAESPLPVPVRHFFEERIRFALDRAGVPVEFQPDHASPVPSEVRSLLASGKPSASAFVRSSRSIAEHLFGIQNAVQSEGLICVTVASLQKARAVALVKLENEEGLRAKLKGPAGRKRFEIEVVPDLMLTQHTRVFKVALFEQAGAKEPEALACDNQRGRGQMLAEFFLEDFLGCRLVAKPDVATRAFLEATEHFINTHVQDPMLRSRYHTALLAEMASNDSAVSARRFADSHMEVADRQPFLKVLQEAEIPRTFQKDTTLVRNRVFRTRFAFEGDVDVTVPPDAIDKTVSMREAADGRTHLELESRLRFVRGVR